MDSILHISRTMGQGGAEKVVFQLATGLKTNFKNTVVASIGGELEKDLGSEEIFHVKTYDIENKSPIIIYKNFNIFKKIIKDNKINIVHIHHRMGLLYAKLIKIYFPKIKILYTAHNIFNDKKIMYKLLLGNIKTVAVGKSVEDDLIKNIKVNKNRVCIIYNCVKTHYKKTINKDDLLETNRKYILCVARLTEQKGVKYLLEAMSYLNEDISLYILGKGEEERILEELCIEFNIVDRVYFLGYKKNVDQYIENCDFMILPSLWEGFPLTPIECFMNGKTIIATNIPGTNEIVDNNNGLLVEPRNSIEIAEAIKYLINNKQIRENKEKHAYKTYLENFSYDKFIYMYENIYKNIK